MLDLTDHCKTELSGKAGDLDHSSPKLIDHFLPAVNICYQVDYIFEYKTGQMWSMLPVFELKPGALGKSDVKLQESFFCKCFT
jgi:hypothetical protein